MINPLLKQGLTRTNTDQNEKSVPVRVSPAFNKIVLTLLLLTIFPLILHADFIIKQGSTKGNSNGSNGVYFDVDNNGTNDLVMTPSGNVGLGITTPSSNFHVAGNINISGNLTSGLNQGLVGWWSFDDGTGTILTDHSGYGNNGTLTNGPVWTEGKFNNALRLDGTDDYVAMSDDSQFPSGTDDRTISAWLKLNSNGGYNVVTWGTEAVRQRCELGTRSGGWVVFAVSTGAYGTNDLPSLGEWFNVTAVFSGTKVGDVKFYINGDLKTTSLQAGGNVDVNTVLNGALQIGTSIPRSSGYFDGKIDSVRIYNRALSATEVSELYRSKSSYFTQGGTISGNTSFSGNLSVATLNLSTSIIPSSPQTGDVYSTGTNLMFRTSTGVWESLVDSTDSVWTQSSGNLSYDGGNVGVGSLSGAEFTVDNQTSTDNILDLYDNATLALSIQDGGDVGIGNAAPSYKLDVSGNAAISSDLTLSSDLTIAGHILPSANNTVEVGSTTYAWRSIYSKDFFVLSDKRRKTNIRSMGSAQAILKKIRPVNYHWKHSPGQKDIGLIAQDVLEVIPEAVSTPKDENGLMAVKYHALIPVLIQVEKEQAEEIEERSKDFLKALKSLEEAEDLR